MLEKILWLDVRRLFGLKFFTFYTWHFVGFGPLWGLWTSKMFVFLSLFGLFLSQNLPGVPGQKSMLSNVDLRRVIFLKWGRDEFLGCQISSILAWRFFTATFHEFSWFWRGWAQGPRVPRCKCSWCFWIIFQIFENNTTMLGFVFRCVEKLLYVISLSEIWNIYLFVRWSSKW